MVPQPRTAGQSVAGSRQEMKPKAAVEPSQAWPLRRGLLNPILAEMKLAGFDQGLEILFEVGTRDRRGEPNNGVPIAGVKVCYDQEFTLR